MLLGKGIIATTMPKPIGNESRYNPGIDGLRTLAVLGVICYHLGFRWMPGGLAGVGVFFTISGFLITGNLMRSWYRRGNLGLKTFWLRRLRRLMPAVILTVLVIWALTPFFKAENWPDYRLGGLTAIFYVNNWATIFWGDSYFDQFAQSPFEHMWSLSVEEQFYLFWPLVLLLLLVISRGRRLPLVILTSILAAASFVWLAYGYSLGMDATRLYEGTDTRAGGLLVGAILAIIMIRPTDPNTTRPLIGRVIFRKDRYLAEVLGWLGLGAVLAIYVFIPDSSPALFNGLLVVLSLATAALLFAISNRYTRIYKLFALRPLAWIGERSYAMYLWHMPLIAFLYTPLQVVPVIVRALIIIGATTGLAALSWILVEDPIRRNGFFVPLWRWLTRRGSLPHALLSFPLAFFLIFSLVGVPTEAATSYHDQLEAKKAALAKAQAERERKAAQERALAATHTRCHQIIHVGDSTSLAMFTDAGVLNPADNATKTYTATGATKVTNSSFGARATNQGYQDYPSGNDSIREILSGGIDKDSCFVIALGTNDAANMNVYGGTDYDTHIRATMDIIGPKYPVLWITTVVNPNGSPRWYTKDVMDAWNAELYRQQKRYPNMWVYPWDKDMRPEWFITGDGVHCNTIGNSERSRRFAQAVVNAWPLTLEGDKAPLLPKKRLAPKQRVVTGMPPQ